MDGGSSKLITQALAKWNDGDDSALRGVLPLLYDELKKLAHHYLRGERADHTLQSTALVHEAYLRLIDQESFQPQNRAHFIAMAARLMRESWWTTPVNAAPPSAITPARSRSMRPSVYPKNENLICWLWITRSKSWLNLIPGKAASSKSVSSEDFRSRKHPRRWESQLQQ
jgi:hypothetical protein